MTEKQYAPTKTEKKTKVDGASKKQKIDVPKIKEKKVEKVTIEKNVEDVAKKALEQTPEIKGEKKTEDKKEMKKPAKKVKKDEVVVNGKSVPVSTKYSMAICRFIKHKTIEKAIKDLEEVIALRKAVPMKGEIPHRKGKMMSGRFPKRAAASFIMLLKSLLGNANNHDLDDPVISEAIANLASRPYGRRGIKRKRTHITLKARNKKLNKKTSRTPRAYPDKSSKKISTEGKK
jgi:ribosomal protein L22